MKKYIITVMMLSLVLAGCQSNKNISTTPTAAPAPTVSANPLPKQQQQLTITLSGINYNVSVKKSDEAGYIVTLKNQKDEIRLEKNDIGKINNIDVKELPTPNGYKSILIKTSPTLKNEHPLYTYIAYDENKKSPVIQNSPCDNVELLKEDPLHGDVQIWKNKDGTYYTLEDGKHTFELISCGEDVNRELPGKQFYIIKAIERGDVDTIKTFLDYQASTDVKDAQGNDLYLIAIASGIKDKTILDKLSVNIKTEQIEKDKLTLKLALQGSTLSITDIENIKKDEISLNSNLADYAYTLSPKDKDYMSGTILGSALINKDIKKVKWLLEQGVDPDLHFGNGEFDISPLRYSLTVLDNLEVTELLLKKGANADEKFAMADVEATLLADNTCNASKTSLLEKYGAKNWEYSEEGTVISKEELTKSCKK